MAAMPAVQLPQGFCLVWAPGRGLCRAGWSRSVEGAPGGGQPAAGLGPGLKGQVGEGSADDSC